MDWIENLGPVVDHPGHAGLRAKIADCLTVAAGFAAALTVLRSQAMGLHGVPVAADVVASMKRAETGLAETLRAARAIAAAFHGGLHIEDAATWEAACRAAEAGLEATAGAIAAGRLAGSGDAAGADAAQSAGAAVLSLAWALTDFPIALRVLRAGTTLRGQVLA